MKIFDVHAHIYPEKIALKAAKSIGDFYFGYPIAGTGCREDCVARMDRAGIEKFAAHSVALTPHNVLSINRFILECHQKYPDRIVPFAAMHPDVPDPEAAVDEIVAAGFRGIKLHPDMQGFAVDSDRALPMMRAIAGKLPLLVHCGDVRYDFDGPKRMLSLHEKVPELQLICAHLGGWMEWDDAARIMPEHNLIVDLSSAIFHWEPSEAADVLRTYGTKNVLFGSDYPMWSPDIEVERFMRIPLTDQERSDILWNNADRLLHLEL